MLLQKIDTLCVLFRSIAFELESYSSNQIAREIAKSVLRDGRFQSYLALGGPAWLHQRILREALLNSSYILFKVELFALFPFLLCNREIVSLHAFTFLMKKLKKKTE